MKKLNQIGTTLLVLAAIAFGLAQTQAKADSIVQITAEVQGLEQVSSDAWAGGTYWEAMPGAATFAPLPGPLFNPTFPVYAITDGIYLVDGTGGQLPPGDTVIAMGIVSNAVVTLINQVQGAQIAQSMRGMGMDVPGPPGFGDGGGGYYYLTNYSGFYTFNTNLLWLQITNVSVSLETAYVNLYNATDQVYAIWSTTNLLIPFSLWQVETEVFPTVSTTNRLPFSVPTLGRQDLFLRAQDWTGVFSNGLPDWWTWYYFHTLDLSWTNQDANNYTLGYDYTNHYDPNTIDFTIYMTNSDVNTAYPNLLLEISAGVPGYGAILVNDTNQADAVWQPFASPNVVATLGTDGVYNVSVGLRGFPTNAIESWQTVELTKNTVFPKLTITSPVGGSTSQSLIQFQGFASEPLDTLTFDLTNASGTFTNQQGYLTGLFYDTNRMAYTTNYFQSADIYLASGANAFALHATDWAGNHTNASFTINFSASTNPPVLTLVWPQAGNSILGSNFTLQAHVSDLTATVSATVNSVSTPGVVDVHGFAWVQNLSLSPGTNTVTLTANTALGGTTTTNFAVAMVANSMGLTVAPIPYYEPNQNLVNISGTINDLATYAVYVNGISAGPVSLGDNTDWGANDVPVSSYGTATLNVLVSNSVLSATETFNSAQPITVAMMSYSGHQSFTVPNTPTEYDNINWRYDSGGVLNDPTFGPFEINAATNGGPYLEAFGWDFNPPWEYASLSTDVPGVALPYVGHTQTRVMVEPGGIGQAGTTNLYLVFATAREFSQTNINNGGIGYEYLAFYPAWPQNGFNSSLPYGGDLGLPPEWLQINGKTLVDIGLTNTTVASSGPNISSVWGATLVSGLAGENVDVTPVATRVYQNLDYTFDVQATNVTLQIFDSNSGINLSERTNTVIVGQQIGLTCQISITNSFMTNFVLTNFQWTVPGVAISNYVVAADASSAIVLTNFPTTNVTAKFYWVDGASNRVVQCSATVNGMAVTGQAIFNVVRPTVDWSGDIVGPIEVDTNYINSSTSSPGSVWLHLGNSYGPDDTIIRGITFTVTNFDFHGYPDNYGSLFCVQVVTNLVVESCGTNGLTVHWASYGMDTTFPYDNLNGALTSGSSDSAHDAPATTCSPNSDHVAYSANFQMYLIFQPDEGIPVPLKAISWNWTASANSITNSQWNLSNSNALITVNNQDIYTYPQWSQNATNFVITTNNICN